VPALVVCLCPSAVHVVTTVAGSGQIYITININVIDISYINKNITYKYINRLQSIFLNWSLKVYVGNDWLNERVYVLVEN
jgi:hypothetical protein